MSRPAETRSESSQQSAPVTSLAELYRDPTANPLATLVATVILGTFGYQASVTAVQSSPLLGALVLVTGSVAYRIARVGWRVENAFVRAALRAEGVDGGRVDGTPADD